MPENLCELFDKDVRPFLDAIDRLRQYSLDEQLRLPTVVVVGDQSSGKSSILEAISGIQLPRGQGIVTRCPLQLQMRKAKHLETPSATLTYMKNEEFQKLEISDMSHIDYAVRAAQKDVTISEGEISETLLSLTVVSADVPDLTVVDLPGIARMNIGNQQVDIYQQIINLVEKYISREEAIILAVCPCTTDLETSEALKLAYKYDPKFERTYGVLTKADLVDKGSEDRLFKIINNEVLSLPKGFLLVKCRGEQDLKNGQSLKEALQVERNFFKRHPVFRNLDNSKWGIDTLSRKLSTDLIDFIKREFPNIRHSLSEKLKSLADQQNKLTLEYPVTPESRMMLVTRRTNDLLMVLYFLIEGKYDSPELDNIEKFIKAKDLPAEFRLIPHIRKEIDKLEKRMINCSPDHSLDALTEQILTENQGKEPLEFLSYPAFKKLALRFIEALTPHIRKTLENIYKNFYLVLDALAKYYFGKFPVLLADLKIVISDTLTSVYSFCSDDLDILLEKEKICFILDKTYDEKLDSLVALQNQKYTMKRDWMSYFKPKQSHKTSPSPSTGFSFGPSVTVYPVQDPSLDNRKQLPKYIAIYYIMTINRICEQVPTSILLMLMNRFLENLKEKLLFHVVQSKTYDLIERDCGGIKEKKNTLDLKIKGLKRGIKEMDRINFRSNTGNVMKDEDEDEDL